MAAGAWWVQRRAPAPRVLQVCVCMCLYVSVCVHGNFSLFVGKGAAGMCVYVCMCVYGNLSLFGRNMGIIWALFGRNLCIIWAQFEGCDMGIGSLRGVVWVLVLCTHACTLDR